jgi:hypothetical protein
MGAGTPPFLGPRIQTVNSEGIFHIATLHSFNNAGGYHISNRQARNPPPVPYAYMCTYEIGASMLHKYIDKYMQQADPPGKAG